MADSIDPAVEDAEARAGRERRLARREFTWEIQERGLAAAQAAAFADAPLRMRSSELACAAIVCQSAVLLGGVWARRRRLSDGEKAILRILGALAFRAGLQEEALTLALETGVEEVLEVVRRTRRTALWTDLVARPVMADLEADAAAFSRAALGELQLGHLVDSRGAAAVTDALCAIVHGRVRGSDVADAAATAGVDSGRAYGVVLLADAQGSMRRCDAAASGIVDRVPYAVDLDCGGLFPHRRVLLPHLSPAQWLEARIEIDAIARRHSVIAVAPAPSDLAALAETYRPLARGLGALIARCGVTAGIVDPACVDGGGDDAAACTAAPAPTAA